MEEKIEFAFEEKEGEMIYVRETPEWSRCGGAIKEKAVRVVRTPEQEAWIEKETKPFTRQPSLKAMNKAAPYAELSRRMKDELGHMVGLDEEQVKGRFMALYTKTHEVVKEVEVVEAVEGEVEPPLDAEEILTEMKKDGKMFFRVRWVGYGSDDDRDEPEENVQNTIVMMQWQDTGRDGWAAGIEELKRKRTEREAARQITQSQTEDDYARKYN